MKVSRLLIAATVLSSFVIGCSGSAGDDVKHTPGPEAGSAEDPAKTGKTSEMTGSPMLPPPPLDNPK